MHEVSFYYQSKASWCEFVFLILVNNILKRSTMNYYKLKNVETLAKQVVVLVFRLSFSL